MKYRIIILFFILTIISRETTTMDNQSNLINIVYSAQDDIETIKKRTDNIENKTNDIKNQADDLYGITSIHQEKLEEIERRIKALEGKIRKPTSLSTNVLRKKFKN